MNRKSKIEEKERINNNESVPAIENEANVDVTPDNLEVKIEEGSKNDLSAQLGELNDKYLRLYSEFDNYRKRTIKEKVELSKYAASEIIEKLLPVLDDFDRALKAFDSTTEAEKALKEGIVLIFNKFISILNQQGLEQMRTIGESFDTDFHEAVSNIPAPSPEQKGKIIDEVEKGYMLHGKVIRYAKVVVGN
ncbi:MAG: nucleotide exchange factor GrpE [Bacteroidales bacterium]|jgi:molecular chaperone GrpE|nr:nucleotide exchange factor GrpE [Bacteroidales bacterium]